MTSCKDCESNKTTGHNFCRTCGADLRKGFAKNVRIAVAFSTYEKFCGYCGGSRGSCECGRS